jgi:predicted DNA-binding transcriptional regulator YafY
MPKKIDYDATHGEKLIKLFAELLFSGRSYSLTELSKMLKCSKQTVGCLVDAITQSYSVGVSEFFDGNRKYFQINKKLSKPLNLTESEVAVLQMCKAFTEHLLGGQLFQEATQALGKSMAHLPFEQRVDGRHFSTIIPGTIDYSSHHEIIQKLIRAMEEKRICKVTYKRIMAKRAKTFYIKPLKIFSHKDSLYLHAEMARAPGKKYKKPDFNPLLAIHRINKIEFDKRRYAFPKSYDFYEIFNKNFGVIKEEACNVEIEFTGYAAAYVTERIWSPDQKITKKRDGKVMVRFSASSEPELISWVLSFGGEAKVIKPKWVVEEIIQSIKNIKQLYIVNT